MKKVIWLLFFLGTGMVNAQNPQALQQLLQTEGLQHAAVGISIKSVKEGRELVNYRAETALTPASVTKLLPTWLALHTKGDKYAYQTSVYYTGELKDSVLDGDVVIVAGGDPTLDSRYFPKHHFRKKLVHSLLQKGIKRIHGEIRVEGSIKGEQIPGTWLWEDVSNYYAAMYLPFNYRDNTLVFRFRSQQPGTPAELLSVEPELHGIRIRNEVLASKKQQDDAWIFGGPYSEVLCIRGTIPSHRSVFSVKGAMHDPAAIFITELKKELAQNGIDVDENRLPVVSKKAWMNITSPSLSEIVYHTNKVSVNLFAEALGHLTGEEDWPKTVCHALTDVGVKADGMILKDACGLSSMNAVPAQLFTDLLVHIGQQNVPAFVASLPVAGVDGGLGGYCSAWPKLKNRMKAKTGSMSGVRCLSGYLTRLDGTELAFTILINHYTCSSSQLQRAIGQFLTSFL